MKRLFCCGAMLLAAWAAHASAQEEAIRSYVDPQEPVWQIYVNVKGVFASPLGNIINELVVRKAPDGQLNVDAFNEALGLDPRTSVGEVYLSGNTFENTSPQIVANLGPSSGNLEGWLLAAPGYQSETLPSGVTLHSFTPEPGKQRIWCAVPTVQATKERVLIAACDRDFVVSQADAVERQATPVFIAELDANTVLAVAVNDLAQIPLPMTRDEPGAALLQVIKTVRLTVSTESSQVTARCKLSSDTPERAAQVYQLLAGMKAMVQLALPEKKPDAKELLEAMQATEIEYTAGENNVTAEAAIGYDVIRQVVLEKGK